MTYFFGYCQLWQLSGLFASSLTRLTISFFDFLVTVWQRGGTVYVYAYFICTAVCVCIYLWESARVSTVWQVHTWLKNKSKSLTWLNFAFSLCFDVSLTYYTYIHIHTILYLGYWVMQYEFCAERKSSTHFSSRLMSVTSKERSRGRVEERRGRVCPQFDHICIMAP